MLYHARVPYLTGGYVGVDIFFVISGYLITRILMRDVETGTYSLWGFYERRIRRIFPALFVMLAVSTALAAWLLLANELRDFARSMLAAAGFVSNYYFMGDAGYFAAPAESKPLLHTWSLAVEEQFYILFPVYLYFAARYFGRWILPITVLLLAASLLGCIFLTATKPDAAFYGSPTRAWELLAGSVIALGLRRREFPTLFAQLMGLAGIGLILVAIFGFSDEMAFPGAYAIVPVVGAVLVIVSTTGNATIAGTLLSAQPVRFIGLISYSLYLWHWPVLVFYRMWRIEHPAQADVVLVVGVSFVLATLSWYFVERPFRRSSQHYGTKAVVRHGAAAIALTAVCAAAILVNRGFPDRYPTEVQRLLSVKSAPRHLSTCEVHKTPEGIKLRMCRLGRDNGPGTHEPRFLVWGDSHAASLLPGFDAAASRAGVAGVFAGRGGCVPLLGVIQTQKSYETCAALNASILKFAAAHPSIRHVILVSRWSIYATGERFRAELGPKVLIRDDESDAVSTLQNQQVFARGLTRTVDALQALGARISILTQTPETEYDIPTALARAEWLGRVVDLRPTVEQYEDRQRIAQTILSTAASGGRARLVDIRPILCDQRTCAIRDENGPLYRDTSHITPHAAELFSAQLERLLDSIDVSSKLQ